MSYRYERNERRPSRGPSPDPRSLRQGTRSREHSPERSKLPPRPYLSPTHSQTSRREPTLQVPTQSRRPSTSRSRTRWPPAPFVEDYNAATRKIHGLPLELYDPPNRGTLDQDSVLVDLYPPTARPVKSSKKAPTKVETFLKRDSKLDFDGNYNPAASDISSTSTAESGYFSTEKNHWKNFNGSNLSDGLESGRRYEMRDRTSPSAYPQDGIRSADVSDNEDDDDSTVSGHGTRAPAPYAGAGSGQRERFSRDFSITDMHSGSSNGSTLDGNPVRRNTDFPMGNSRPRFDEFPQTFIPAKRDAPPPVSRAYLPENTLLNAVTAAARSRPSSPTSSPGGTPSPPRSPRYSRDSSPVPRGARSPMSGSRPSSPVSGQPDAMRRASTFPIVADNRSQKTSRLATSSMTVDQLDSPVIPPARPVLPYPMDDTLIMPSAADHAYKPRDLDDPHVPRLYGDDNRIDRNSRPPPLEMPSRPKMESRNTHDGTTPTSARSPAAMFSDALMPKTPRKPSYMKCLVSPSRKDFQEWYSLPGTSVLDICPFCVESKLSKTPYAAKVERRERSVPNPDARCCFTSKWYHLAWEVLQNERAATLHLLGSIARIDREVREKAEKPCPGKSSKSGKWMVLRPRSAEPSIPFFVCSVDTRKIIKLLPELKGEFEVFDSHHRETCALHEEGHRFEKMTNALVAADADAHRKKRKPDMIPFIQLARVLAQTAPCQRDSFMHDTRWHFAPQTPALTICPECYTTIVWPEVAAGSAVAKRIEPTEQALLREHPVGHTCQLWSPRMIGIFKTAVKSNDFKLLADAAEKRAQMEHDLRLEWMDLDERKRELDRPGVTNREARLDDIQRAFHDLAAEWKRYE